MKKILNLLFLILGGQLANGVGIPGELQLSPEDRGALTDYVDALPDHYEGGRYLIFTSFDPRQV